MPCYDSRVEFAHGRLGRAIDGLAHLVFPAECVGCRCPLGLAGRRGTICRPCFDALPRLLQPICARCGDPLDRSAGGDPACDRCREASPAFVKLRSGGAYTGGLRAALLAFKFRRHDFLARHLVAFALGDADVADLVHGAAHLVPVPMHAAKQRRRGYNPAELLARELAAASRARMDLLLRKDRPTDPQSRLPLAARKGNVRGTFIASGPIPGAVLLVDDVTTSSETLRECARVLLAAGAARVDAVTIARTARSTKPDEWLDRPLEGEPTEP